MKHPIVKFEDFESMYKALETNVGLGYINKKVEGDLALYDYSKSCTYDRAWNDATMIARGLVLDEVNKELVALPFPKFFNEGGEHNEHGEELGDFVSDGFFEKMDGSCGIIYHYNGEWRVNTRGSFTSDQAIWAKKYLDENIETDFLPKNGTYLVEIIYPENKVVVDYGNEIGLCLIGSYKNKEIEDSYSCLSVYEEALQDYELLKIISNLTGFKYPKLYKFNSIDEAKTITESFDHNQEGFVYRSSNGVRVKIKGAEYCRVHGLISYHTPLFLWRRFTHDGENACWESKKDLPEEVWGQFDEWMYIFKNNINKLKSEAVEYFNKHIDGMTNKEIGLAIKNGTIDFPYSHDFFEINKNRETYAEFGTKAFRSLCERFEPKFNVMVEL